MGDWTRAEPKVSPAGDPAGDHQVSNAYSVRWYRQLGTGEYAVVTRYYYAQVRYEGAPPPYALMRQTEYLVCTNLDNVGGSEVRSDYRYRDEGPVAAGRLNEAVEAAATSAPPPGDREWPWPGDFTAGEEKAGGTGSGGEGDTTRR